MIVLTPIRLNAAMFARFGTSCGASSWWTPCLDKKAIGMDLPVEGDGWCSTAIGEDGAPQGVEGLILATCVKSAREARPVPPMTAMCIGSVSFLSVYGCSGRGEILTVVVICYVRHLAVAYV